MKKAEIYYLVIFLFSIFGIGHQLTTSGKCAADIVAENGCPLGWSAHEENCIFAMSTTLYDYQQALDYCKNAGAKLIKVSNLAEHAFISDFLLKNSVNKSISWYTAGKMHPSNFGQFIWDGYGVDIFLSKEIMDMIIDKPEPLKPEGWDKDRIYLAMGYHGSKYKFTVVTAKEQLYFSCLGNKITVNRLSQYRRQPDFNQIDLRNIQRGPCIIENPKDMLYFPKVDNKASVTFSCDVIGNPEPLIHWYLIKATSDGTARELINPLSDLNGQVSQTAGLLTIHKPDSRYAHGIECEASNTYGTVVSNRAKIIFATGGDYKSGVKQTKFVNSNEGFILDCEAPRHTPDGILVYTFYFKPNGVNQVESAIQESTRNNIFLSRNKGFIGFSIARQLDSGTYRCMISIKGLETSGTSQISFGLPLNVGSTSAQFAHPFIQDGFPNYQPDLPLMGQSVRFECFGYGAMLNNPLKYMWKWKGGEIPSKAIISDFGRVLTLPNVQIEDQGLYGCRVLSSANNRISEFKETILSVYSAPTFIQRPTNQFVDVDSDIQIPCSGFGNPNITLTWYRNNVPLRQWVDNNEKFKGRYNFTEGVINSSVLSISKISSEDNGMLGCVLYNKFGYNSGYFELKAFLFAANFQKYPINNQEAMVGGYIMLSCNPEGAPAPTITWTFNGATIGTGQGISAVVDATSCGAKYCVLANNLLVVTKVELTDSGNYTCIAKNSLGEATSSALVTVVPAITSQLAPTGRRVKVNTNVALPCQASNSPYLDVEYNWYFENVPIRFDRLDLDGRRFDLSQFSRPYHRYYGSMTISNIQFYDEGQYVCKMTTPIQTIEKEALIYVLGPPGEAGGLNIIAANGSSNYVVWTNGNEHGRPITHYVLEVAEDSTNQTWFELTSFNESQVIQIDLKLKNVKRRQIEFSGLPANRPFFLRIIAFNEFGRGTPSPRSKTFVTPPKPPSRAPVNVTGGGGKMSTLVVRWEKLLSVEENGPEFTYHVRYREAKEKEWVEVSDLYVVNLMDSSFVDKYRQTTLTLSEKRYNTPYIVQVRAHNSMGSGPWSEESHISSAPKLLGTTPNNVEAASFNSTAITVTWTPPETRPENGIIIGYRIIYWIKSHDCKIAAAQDDRIKSSQRLTLYNLTENVGTIIGLETDTYYCIGVQAMNYAGDGPESSFFDQTTFKKAPQNFPTLVHLNSTGTPHQIRVSWVGVRVNPDEESIDGYTIRYWLSGGPVRSALDINCGMDTTGLINGLLYDTRYNVRVFAHSRGGHGKLSNPMEQFMLLPASECSKDQIRDGPDVRYVFICGSCRIWLSTTLLTIVTLLTSMLTLMHHLQ